MAEIIQLNRPPKWMAKAMETFKGMPKDDIKNLLSLVVNELFHEIKKGLAGEEESEFFEVVNRMFFESRITGCFLCDPTIDVNDKDVKFTEIGLCIPCSHKASKMFKELGLDMET